MEMNESKKFDDQFASLLRAKRLEAGYSQEKLAEICGSSKSTVYNHEKGATTPSFYQAAKYAIVLDISIDRFLRIKHGARKVGKAS
jgi:DNA-binding XRE family transcriptional regulator